MGHRSEEGPQGQADRGRPALHAFRRRLRFLRADSRRFRHRLPRRRHQLPAVEGQDPSRVRQELHQRRIPDRRRLQVRGRPVLRLQRRKAQLRQGHLEVPDRQGRLCHGRSDPGKPELRVPADEEALQPLHAGTGEQDHRHAAGRLPQDLRNDGGDVGARQDHDDLLCAGLDRAFGRLAEHPHHGPDPAPARQHGHGGRRHQRAARPRQRAGHHRHVPVFGSAARLPVGADRCRRRSQDLSGEAHAEGRCGRTR
jgi:hypothetical protein